MKRAVLLMFLLLLFSCSEEKGGLTPQGDTESPTVEITSPPDSSSFTSTFEVSCEAEDNEAVFYVEFYLDSHLELADSASPYDATLPVLQPLDSLELGAHIVKVCAHDFDGNSACDSITVFKRDVSSATLSAAGVGSHSVSLVWTRNNDAGFVSYNLYYSSEPGVDTTSTLACSVTSREDTLYTVSSLSSGTTYYFRLATFGVSGGIAYSNEVQVETDTSTGGDGAEMVYIPGGEFEMGDNSGLGTNDEAPLHIVHLDPYYIDKYEVTNALFEQFINDGGYTTREYWSDDGWEWKQDEEVSFPEYWESGEYNSGPSYTDYPVVGVSWYEAEAYCVWAGKRLPTEAEWELAAKGTEGNIWPWGNEFFQEIEGETVHCNFNGSDGGRSDPYERSSPVGSFPTGDSPYGVSDMAGNVEEWCYDWYSNTYYQGSPMDNPQGPVGNPTTDSKVERGGSWIKYSYPDLSGFYFRTSKRYYKDPDRRKHYIGFRCVRSAD